MNFIFTWVGRQLSSATLSNYVISFDYDDSGRRISKTAGSQVSKYYYDGSLLISERQGDYITVYLYDNNGLPIGFAYREPSYASNVYDIFWYEKNLQGDIVAIYNQSGTKLVSYMYDAWGNCTISYHNGASSGSAAAKNKLRFRGYYFDTDLNLYYCGTRYYDANTGRWINADTVMSGVNGSLHGFNLYVYCFNNPIMYTDYSGNWPSWKDVGDFSYNILEAIITSFEFEIGVGYGIGFNLLDNVTADLSRDTYVGFDDGQFTTGNVITAELSLFDSKISIGDTYNHLVEKGGEKVTSSGSAMDGPFDMIYYPDVTHGNKLTVLIFSINDKGDFVVEATAGAHVGAGGYIYFGFNITEYLTRLFD